MLKKTILLSLLGSIPMVYADNDLTKETQEISESTISSENNYIARQAYIENAYIGMPSGGGTQDISESQLLSNNPAKRLFADGTWNVFGSASYLNQNGANNYGYGVNIFGQTGQLGGFSVGGLLTISNPFFSSQINPRDQTNQAQTLPIAYQVTPQELFLEYQYDHRFQLDAGYIGISNSPWMTYYQNNALNLVTYQGAIVNIDPGAGWLLTAFAINGAQLLGENGFGQQTMYNQAFDYGTGTANITDQSTPATVAMGANWTSPGEMLNARLWAYAFGDYSNLLYADSTIKLPINDDLGFTLGVQGAMQGDSFGKNILNTSGYGNSVKSNLLGLQLGFNYSIFALQLGYDNVWGPSGAYENGGLVSPYTYQMATDPLYTSGWMQGLVEKSAGQAYKIAPSLSLLVNNLVISPSYQYYATTGVAPSTEYDLTLSYNIPQVKGLTIFAGYGYTQQPADAGGDTYQAQTMLSYLY